MCFFSKIKINNEYEIKVFNITIAQYGQRFVDGVSERYFYLFPKSFKKIVLDKILQDIPREHDCIILLRTNGSGEANLINYSINTILKNLNVKNPCYASHCEQYKSVILLFSNDIPFYHFKLQHNQYAECINSPIIKYKKRIFYVWDCTLKDSKALVEEYSQNKGEHKCEVIKKWHNIKEYDSVYPTFDEEIIKSVKNKFDCIDMNLDKFIFLAPESKGTKEIPQFFWELIIKNAKILGYDVFVNTRRGYSELATSLNLSVSEALYLASISKAIISLRSGFTELCASLKYRPSLFVLYNDFLQKITSEYFLKVYTIKEYPFINKENIYEYTVNDDLNYNLFAKSIILEIQKGDNNDN